MRLLAFFKREAVLTVAALCALATMVLVPPDAAYLGYIDLRVLCLLLCLMAVVAGFQSCGAFQWLAGHLLSRGTGPRALAVILVLLPFFCSMAVTNDVALITFAPFALLLLDQMDCRAAAVPLLVLQTIAANLGSMATPVGNPQNLYLYGAYGLSAGDFFPVVLPLAGISLACLTAAALPVLPRDLQIPPVHPQPLRQPGKLALYGALFLLCLLTVFRILPYGLLTVLVLGTLAAVEPALLRKLDVSLLCTFICFFVVSGKPGTAACRSWVSPESAGAQHLADRRAHQPDHQQCTGGGAAVGLHGQLEGAAAGRGYRRSGNPGSIPSKFDHAQAVSSLPGGPPRPVSGGVYRLECSAAGGAAVGGLAHVGGGVISDINRRHGQAMPPVCAFTRYRSSFFRSRQSGSTCSSSA